MLTHAATLLLSVGDIMGFNSPEQFTSHSPLPVDGGERKFRLNSPAPPRGHGQSEAPMPIFDAAPQVLDLPAEQPTISIS